MVKFETPIWRVAPRSRALLSEAMVVGDRQRPARPMDEDEIDLTDAELLQASVHRTLEGAIVEVFRRDLGGDEDVVAGDARGADPLPDPIFVAVGRGGVDVPVADAERLGDGAGAGLAAEPPRAEADDRNRRAVGRRRSACVLLP